MPYCTRRTGAVRRIRAHNGNVTVSHGPFTAVPEGELAAFTVTLELQKQASRTT